jgi:hypothetical protein
VLVYPHHTVLDDVEIDTSSYAVVKVDMVHDTSGFFMVTINNFKQPRPTTCEGETGTGLGSPRRRWRGSRGSGLQSRFRIFLFLKINFWYRFT